MIIAELVEYYDRKVAHKPGALPEYGFGEKEITHVILYDSGGVFKGIHEFVDKSNTKGKSFLVAKDNKRSGTATPSNNRPNFLYDTRAYSLGIDKNGNELDDKFQFEKFIETMENAVGDDDEIKTLVRFLRSPSFFSDMQNHPNFKGMVENGQFISFAESERWLNLEPIAADRKLIGRYINHVESQKKERSLCIISGKPASIAETHPIVYINGKRANLVSFNNESFTHFGKEQGFNSPISDEVAFKYSTALNDLLKSEKNRYFLSGTNIIFWTRKESVIGELIENSTGLSSAAGKKDKKDNPDEKSKIAEVSNLFAAIHNESSVADADTNKFVIAGISNNNARGIVNFMHTSTVEKIADNIRRYLDDIKVREDEFTSVFSLLASTTTHNDIKSVPKALSRQFITAIIMGKPYPGKLYAAALNRAKANRNLSLPHEALIKAYLRRNYTFPSGKEITAMLNRTNNSPAYLCGRLFAFYVKLQEDALGKLNNSVKNRFYSSAMTSPLNVIPVVDKLSVAHEKALLRSNHALFHHISKEKGEIMNLLDGKPFPDQMSLKDQGVFLQGYAHQYSAFFTKKSDKEQTP